MSKSTHKSPSDMNQKARSAANKARQIAKDAKFKEACKHKAAQANMKPAVSSNGIQGTASEAQAKHNLKIWKRKNRLVSKEAPHNHRFDNTIACRMLHKGTDLPCNTKNFHKVIENVQFSVNTKH